MTDNPSKTAAGFQPSVTKVPGFGNRSDLWPCIGEARGVWSQEQIKAPTVSRSLNTEDDKWLKEKQYP
jgi:hypothetical protein